MVDAQTFTEFLETIVRPITSNSRSAEYQRKWKEDRKRDAIVALGGRCIHCGESDYRVLGIVKYDGSKSDGTTITHVLSGNITPREACIMCLNCRHVYEVEGRKLLWEYQQLSAEKEQRA